MLRNIVTIALNDLRIFFSNRGNLLGLIVLPIGFTLLLGFFLGGGGGPTRIRLDVVDADQSPQADELIASLQANNPNFIICPYDVNDTGLCRLEDDQTTLTVDESRQRVIDGAVQSAIVIPAGFGAALADNQPIALTYYAQSDVRTGDPVFQAMQAELNMLNSLATVAQVAQSVADETIMVEGVPQPLYRADADRDAYLDDVTARAQNYLNEDRVPVTVIVAENVETPRAVGTGFGQSVPGMSTMYVMFTVLGGLALLARERQQWTLARLMVLPLSRAEILGGKMLAYFTLGMIQYGIVFLVGFVVGENLGTSPLALVLVMMAFSFCMTALAFALATRITSEQQASSVTLMLALALAPLGGAWWPLEITPDIMQAIGRLSPVSWAMDGFKEVIYFNGGVSDVLLPVGVLVGIALVLFFIGVRGFRFDV